MKAAKATWAGAAIALLIAGAPFVLSGGSAAAQEDPVTCGGPAADSLVKYQLHHNVSGSLINKGQDIALTCIRDAVDEMQAAGNNPPQSISLNESCENVVNDLGAAPLEG